jgi:hypothetical protein
MDYDVLEQIISQYPHTGGEKIKAIGPLWLPHQAKELIRKLMAYSYITN